MSTKTVAISTASSNSELHFIIRLSVHGSCLYKEGLNVFSLFIYRLKGDLQLNANLGSQKAKQGKQYKCKMWKVDVQTEKYCTHCDTSASQKITIVKKLILFLNIIQKVRKGKVW